MMARARALCDQSLSTLGSCVDQITTAIAKEPDYDKDLVSHLAWLTERVTAVMSELRQQDKARARALGEFSVDEIVAYLRALPKAQRDQAFTAAFDADASEPLL